MKQRTVAADEEPAGAGRESSRAGAVRELALVLFAVAFGTNVPTPLLLAYQDRLGLSATTLTVVFAVYAAGLVPALLVAGPLSDRLGRRPVVVPFVALSAVASLVLVGATVAAPPLFLGRLLQGAVSGVVFSVGSAWIADLEPDAGRAARTATTAMSLGFCLGPLTSGLLAQYLPAPTVLPYVLHLALMAIGLLAVRRVAETVPRRPGRGPLINLGVPRPARAAFLTFVVPAALLVFTFPSVSITVLPLGLREAMPGADLAITGLIGGLALGSGVLVQPLERRLGTLWAAPLAALCGVLGLLVGLAAEAADAPFALLPAAVLLGAGYGLSLAAGLTATQWLADPASKGALVATFYAVTYLGFGAPVVVSSLSNGTDFNGALVGLTVVAAVLGLLLLAGPGRSLIARARPAPAG